MFKKIARDKTILIAISIGIAYLWFGLLKFFPHLSPAEDLAIETIAKITFHAIPEKVSIFILAIWESLVGALLLINYRKRWLIFLALVHMLFTFAPLFIMSDACFERHFYEPNLLGQYIIKNLIIVSALIVLLPQKSNSQNPNSERGKT